MRGVFHRLLFMLFYNWSRAFSLPFVRERKKHEAPPPSSSSLRWELSGAEVAFPSFPAGGLNRTRQGHSSRTITLLTGSFGSSVPTTTWRQSPPPPLYSVCLPTGSPRWPGRRRQPLHPRECARVCVCRCVRVYVVFVGACVLACLPASLTIMPRSFLVKKVKLDDFSTGAELEHAYRHRTDLSLRLHDKGRSGCLHSAGLTGVSDTDRSQWGEGGGWGGGTGYSQERREHVSVIRQVYNAWDKKVDLPVVSWRFFLLWSF